MIESMITVAIGGFLLGLAGSLHCTCMCGGLASGAMFMLAPRSDAGRLIALLHLQAGRIAVYAAAGGVIAGTTSFLVDPSAASLGYRGLQWLGAAVLMWVGLSTAGMLPRFLGPSSLSLGAATRLAPRFSTFSDHPRLASLGLGMTWGLTPCPMVYAALISASLTGSVSAGSLWMLSFGLGTVPAVVAAALGISRLSRFGRSPVGEITAGLAVALVGFATLYVDWPRLAAVCLGG